MLVVELSLRCLPFKVLKFALSLPTIHTGLHVDVIAAALCGSGNCDHYRFIILIELTILLHVHTEDLVYLT